MKKTKKLLFTLVSSALIATSVAPMASCATGNNTPSGNVNAVAYDGSAVTVTFYHTMGEKLREVLNTYIPDFNAMYPNITIDHQAMGGYPDLRDQISTELTAGNSPSMAYCYPDHVALYNKAKAVATLDNFIALEGTATKADGTTEQMGFTDTQLGDFVKGYYDEGKEFGDGLMYTLPYSKSTEVLYYNKTYFTENNLQVPTTWDEMKTLCQTIKAKEGSEVIPLGYDSESNWFITQCEQRGLGYTTATKGELFKFNTADHQAFMAEFREWYEAGLVTTGEISTFSYTSKLFTKTTGQRCYMSIGSSGGASNQCPQQVTNEDGTTSYPFEVGVAMIPQYNKDNQKVISQGPSLCMFKKSEQEMAATWLFMKFLTTYVPLQANFSQASGYSAVINSVTENENYANFLANADGNARLTALAIKQAQTEAHQKALFVSPAFDGSSAARDVVGQLVQDCVLKELEGKTAAQLIAGLFDDAIDELEYDYGS